MRNLSPIAKKPLWTKAGTRGKPGALGLTQTSSSRSENQVAWLLPDFSLPSLLTFKLCLAPFFSDICALVERDGALQTA